MKDKSIIFCDVQSDNGSDSCQTCKNAFVTDIWCDLKCKFPNHIMNKEPNGLVCKDFDPIVKHVITEDIEGGVVDDLA